MGKKKKPSPTGQGWPPGSDPGPKVRGQQSSIQCPKRDNKFSSLQPGSIFRCVRLRAGHQTVTGDSNIVQWNKEVSREGLAGSSPSTMGQSSDLCLS